MDEFNLERFITAQASHYEAATAELRAGRKSSHWMWFVFPQLKGLGSSAKAKHFGISGLEEAQAYLAHSILGDRLNETTRLMLSHQGRTATDILGYPDDLKFCSCMTLFAAASSPDSLFQEAIRIFFKGFPDEATLRLLTPQT